MKSASIVTVFNKSEGWDSLSPLVTFLSGLLTVLKLSTHQKICIPLQVRKHC